jgi:glycosyltransferase involved in cell wall biosynthesis
MEPLVSILIPAYNAQSWIASAITSAARQTWKKKEMIVVDDGSTDSTLAVARQFEGKTVCLLTQENAGASAARNRALNACQGDYIQWLDADDVLEREKIATQLNGTPDSNSRTLVSSAWGRFYHRLGKAKFTPTVLWQDLSPRNWLTLKFRENVWMPTQSWLVSRTLTDLAGPWDESLSFDDDGEYFSRLISHSDHVRFVSAARSYVRRASVGSLSNEFNLSPTKLNSQLRSMKIQMNYLLGLGDGPETRSACVTYLQNWLPYFYPERPDIVAQIVELAANLGGELRTPTPGWKYTLPYKLCGWRGVKRVRQILPRARMRISVQWDRWLSLMDS